MRFHLELNSGTSDPDGWAVSEIGRCPLPSSEREAAQLAVPFQHRRLALVPPAGGLRAFTVDADLPGEIKTSTATALTTHQCVGVGVGELLNVTISSQQESIDFTCCKLPAEQGNPGLGACK